MPPSEESMHQTKLFFLLSIDESSYISHAAVASNKAAVVSKELIKVLHKTDSISTLKILASDGEPANSGHIGTFFHFNCNYLQCYK